MVGNEREIYTYKRTIEENKELIKKYPFLHPVNSIDHGSMWINEEMNKPWKEDYDYSYTLLDDMPNGWNYTFGIQMCDEIIEALKLDGVPLKDYKVQQVKEKFGGLRWYDIGGKNHVRDVVRKYEELSEEICCCCGKPATYYSVGWVLYWCDNCIEKNNPKGYRKIEPPEK